MIIADSPLKKVYMYWHPFLAQAGHLLFFTMDRARGRMDVEVHDVWPWDSFGELHKMMVPECELIPILE